MEILQNERAEPLRSFKSQLGWKINVEGASGKPLWPAGFDPLNVSRVSEKLIIHKRWLKLRNNSGALEILNHSSLFTFFRNWAAKVSDGPGFVYATENRFRFLYLLSPSKLLPVWEASCVFLKS